MKSYHVVLKFPDCTITSTKIKSRDRSLAYLTMYIAWTNERLWITDDQNSQRQESFNNNDHHGPLEASCQLVNMWVLGSILEVPLFTSDSYGSRRIIHTSRSELWHISKAVALKSWYLYFLPDTPETTFGLETRDETLRNLQDSFTVHTRRIHDPWHGLLAL